MVEEARRDHSVGASTERGVREYNDYCVHENRCLFVTKETSRAKPSTPETGW